MGEDKAIVVVDAGDLPWQGGELGLTEFTVVSPHFTSSRYTFTGPVYVPAPRVKGPDTTLNWALERFPQAKFFTHDGDPLGSAAITVRVQQAGFHRWNDAPDEVAYLRSNHRHIFLADFTIENLNHLDRAQEFHLVQAWVAEQLRVILNEAKALGLSCEMMAYKLCIRGRVKYASAITCVVSEDGENSAKVRI